MSYKSKYDNIISMLNDVGIKMLENCASKHKEKLHTIGEKVIFLIH